MTGRWPKWSTKDSPGPETRVSKRERLRRLAAKENAAYCYTCECLTLLPLAHKYHDCTPIQRSTEDAS